MTKLLVSVRSREEVFAAIEGNADLIDLKEPNAGALGATSSEVWMEARTAIGERVPLSAALGELLEFIPTSVERLDGFRYTKLGLAGCRNCSNWAQRWQAALSTLPRDVDPVAVIYADHAVASAPLPCEVVAEAIRLRIRVLLIDTYAKRAGNLFDCLSEEELQALIAAARGAGMQIALAGSLRGETIDQAQRLGPDWIAVRGAVCKGHRTGTIESELVRQLKSRLSIRNHKVPQVPCPAIY